MREMVSRSSFSWDQAGMTERTASHMISTWATDFFSVIHILVVNIADPACKHLNSENEGLYTAPDLAFAVPPAASSGYFSPGPDPSDPGGCGGCTLIFALDDVGNISEKAIFEKKLVFQRAHAIGTFGVR